MSSFVGLVLLAGLVFGGVYLYLKVERLDQEIAKQKEKLADDDVE